MANYLPKAIAAKHTPESLELVMLYGHTLAEYTPEELRILCAEGWARAAHAEAQLRKFAPKPEDWFVRRKGSDNESA